MTKETKISLNMGALALVLQQHLELSFGGRPVEVTSVESDGFDRISVAFRVAEKTALESAYDVAFPEPRGRARATLTEDDGA